MAKKGPSLSRQRYQTNDDYDFNGLLSDASREVEITIPAPEINPDIDTETLQKINEETDAALFGNMEMGTVQMQFEPVQKPEPEPEPQPVIRDNSDGRLNFNEIQEPVVWGSNVFDINAVPEPKPEPEPEPEPEPTRRARTTAKPQRPEEPVNPVEPVEKQKKQPKKQTKEKAPKISTKKGRTGRIQNAESTEELETMEFQQQLKELDSQIEQESSETTEKPVKGKAKKSKKSKKEKTAENYEPLPPKEHKGFPKTYFDPTDAEVDDKDGKTYYYFNIEKTLRNKNMMWVTKIIPLYKLEDMTFDNPNFDSIAQKQHDKTVKLNKMNGDEQYKYELKQKMLKIGVCLGIVAGLFFQITQNTIPKKNFEKANQMIVAQDYENAYNVYTNLGEKYDSYIYAKYCEGQVFLQLAKEASSGTAGANVSAEEKEKNSKLAIERYEKAKECFELLESSYYTYLKAPLNITEEEASALISDLINDCDYNKARMLYQTNKYEEASNIFKTIYSYKDSTDNYYKCMYAIANEYYEEGDYFLAIENFYPIAKAEYSDADTRLKELAAQLYDEAVISYNKKDYESAIERFSFLSDYNYLDSKDMVNKCKYNYAIDFYKEKNYEKASNYFLNTEKYKDSFALRKDCIYKLGVIAYNENPISSVKYFNEIKGYKNTVDILNADNLVIYGKWKITEINGSSVNPIEISFNGDGNLTSDSANLLGVAISTKSTPYNYVWNENGYSVNVDNTTYTIELKIIDSDNLYLIASDGQTYYEYKCERLLTYLQLVDEDNNNDFEANDADTLNDKIKNEINDYIKLKMDYLYTIDNNDIDVTAVKTQVNIILKQEEAQKEQNPESQTQETEKPVEENTETATQNDETSSSEENTQN